MKKLFFTAICAMVFSNGFAQSGINLECASIAKDTRDAFKDTNPNTSESDLIAIEKQAYNTCVDSGSNTVIVVGPVDKVISKN